MLNAAQNETAADQMYAGPVSRAVTQLTLTDFRNYATARLDVGAHTIVLNGANGAGKTNVLEALSYLTAGRGLRGARLGDVARFGGVGGWAGAAQLD
ncbi:MAG: AAA family ATPase, partial [Proteobacteria bacterium]|nr:AAA family ATPase [Pseudomonadota bacterium]